MADISKVAGKKARDAAAADAEMAKKQNAGGAAGGSDKENESKDVLGESEDADVIF